MSFNHVSFQYVYKCLKCNFTRATGKKEIMYCGVCDGGLFIKRPMKLVRKVKAYKYPTIYKLQCCLIIFVVILFLLSLLILIFQWFALITFSEPSLF